MKRKHSSQSERRKRRKLFSDLDTRHFAITLKKVVSNLTRLHMANGCFLRTAAKNLLASVLLLHRNQNGITYIAESVPKSSLTIFNDRLETSAQSTLPKMLFQISLRELTSSEKVLKPFWNPACKEISEQLWLPTGTACADLALNSLNRSSSLGEGESSSTMIPTSTNQASKNSQRTSCPSFTYTAAGKWEKEDTPKLKTRKVRLYPTHEQRILLHQWMGVSRRVYNRTVADINSNGMRSWMNLRDDHVTKTSHRCAICSNKTRSKMCCEQATDEMINDSIEQFELEVPKQIRQSAVREAHKNFKSAFTNLRNGNISSFKVGYQSKKRQTSQSFEFESCSVKYKQNGYFHIFPNITKKMEFKIGKRQKKEMKNISIEHGVKLNYNKLTRNFHLLIPISCYKEEYAKERKTIVSLDPGSKHFITGYSPDGDAFHISLRREKIMKLKKKIAEMQSARKTKQCRKHYKKITDIVTDDHWQIIKYLTSSYENIVLPPFESQELVSISRNRGMNKNLMVSSHYLFYQRLSFKCQLIGTRLSRMTEEYTSKTCTCCGTVKNKLSLADRVYRCDNCRVSIDRDVNGARNILIKCLASSI